MIDRRVALEQWPRPLQAMEQRLSERIAEHVGEQVSHHVSIACAAHGQLALRRPMPSKPGPPRYLTMQRATLHVSVLA